MNLVTHLTTPKYIRENFCLHVVFQSKSAVPPEQGLSNGLIILVIAIVVGCFAVLWPK